MSIERHPEEPSRIVSRMISSQADLEALENAVAEKEAEVWRLHEERTPIQAVPDSLDALAEFEPQLPPEIINAERDLARLIDDLAKAKDVHERTAAVFLLKELADLRRDVSDRIIKMQVTQGVYEYQLERLNATQEFAPSDAQSEQIAEVTATIADLKAEIAQERQVLKQAKAESVSLKEKITNLS